MYLYMAACITNHNPKVGSEKEEDARDERRRGRWVQRGRRRQVQHGRRRVAIGLGMTRRAKERK